MAKEVRFYHLWEIKTVLTTIVVSTCIIIFLGVYFFYHDLYDYYRLSRYDAYTSGQLIKVEEKTQIKQTKLGSRVTVDHYEIKYIYEVDGSSFEQADVLLATEVNRYVLGKIVNSKDSALSVRYSSEDPVRSSIDLRDKK